MTQDCILIARGILNWPRSERVSNRYGVINISEKSGGYLSLGEVPEDPACSFNSLEEGVCAGQKGTLFALVLETRESGHIGDMFRGIGPETPEVGERMELGAGTVFYEDRDGTLNIGVRPDDGRGDDWMNPVNLYRCHEQTVELQFEPIAKATGE